MYKYLFFMSLVGIFESAVAQQCSGGRHNGTLDTKCLLMQVEDRSDNGKMIVKDGDFHYRVDLTFTLISVDNLGDDGTLQTRIRLKTQWHDPNLAWNANELMNKEDLILMPSTLARWPRFVVIEDQDTQRSLMTKMSEFPVSIKSDGSNTMKAEVTTITSCNMDTTYFPQDIQTCRIQIALHPLNYRNIANLTAIYSHDDDLFDDSIDWPLEPTYSSSSTEALRAGVEMDDTGGTLYAYLEIAVKRNSHDIDVALVHPMYTFSFITTIIYILPPDSGERIGSAITMLLTMAVTMLAVKDILPNANVINDGYPFFSVFCRICFAQTIALFIQSIFVIAIHSCERPKPKCIPPKKRIGSNEYDMNGFDEGKSRGLATQQSIVDANFWKKLARIIDWFFLFASLVVSIVSVSWTIININQPPRPAFRRGTG